MHPNKMICLTAALSLIFPVVTWASDTDGDGVDDTIDVCCETPPDTSVDPKGRPLGDLDGDCDVDQDDFGIMQRNFTGPKPPGEGPCPIDCTTSNDCLANQYCAKPAGQCDIIGVCEPRPLSCPDVWDPVCGCDGNTYGNECDANAAGVSVDFPGACPIPCTDSNECAPQDYCAKETGNCDSQGECTPRPEICPLVWDPICGCDGQTYANECTAALNGVNVDYDGECLPPTCTRSEDCPVDEYCAKQEGACEAEGTCDRRPATCPDLWDPVCGCDAQSYDNECWAALHGVSIDYPGLCAVDCRDNTECDEDSYCAKDTGDCEGTGACELRPTICPLVYDPVCGCDGRTYSNACAAAANGVNIDYAGECR